MHGQPFTRFRAPEFREALPGCQHPGHLVVGWSHMSGNQIPELAATSKAAGLFSNEVQGLHVPRRNKGHGAQGFRARG